MTTPLIAWTTNPDDVLQASTNAYYRDTHVIQTPTELKIYDTYEHFYLEAHPTSTPNEWHANIWTINDTRPDQFNKDKTRFALAVEVYKTEHPQPTYTATIQPKHSPNGQWTLPTLKGYTVLMCLVAAAEDANSVEDLATITYT